MNKVKWSFSLILALFIVGILSTAAFASDPYNLQTVQNSSGLGVSFTGNTSDSVNTSFDLVLMDGKTKVNTYPNILINSSKQGTFTIPSGDLTIDKVYTVQLYKSSDTNTMLSESNVWYTNNSHNTKLYQTPDSHVDVNGSGLLNSNETGLNTTKKARTGQQVHGFYQNNTNSCASCHETHTAADGESLLFKDGTYSTCSACHDGTTGAYNSFSPDKSTVSNSIAGTFNIASDNPHGSIHQSDGSLQVSAAPGGNNSSDTSTSLYAATWGQDFDCASCHAPHGGGSVEENNLNVDPLGWGGVQYVAGGTKDEQNGKLFKGITVFSSVPQSLSTPYILVKTTPGDVDPSGVTSDKTKIGYLYYRVDNGASIKNTTPIIQTYRWDGTKYVPDYSLWLRSSGYVSAPFKNANTVLYDSTGNNITINGITVIWRDGFAYGSGISNVASADLSIGIDVETNSQDAAALYDKNDPNYVVDSGVEMTKYCTACHTDYATDPATGNTGVLTAYHRHTENGVSGLTDQLTCVRCHFAHGTTASIMKDANNTNPSTDNETLSDTNHSSALRRFTNMDSCYTSGCHVKTPGATMFLEWSY